MRRVAEKNRAHQRCLRGQLEFEEEVANAEKLEERREYEEGLRTEAVFQEKMKQVCCTGGERLANLARVALALASCRRVVSGGSNAVRAAGFVMQTV